MTTVSDSTIIVGAGWAGLAAALTLTRQGRKVILLEAAPQAGGRARGISFGSYAVDNGQHLLMGAYTQTLTLLKWLNIPEEQVFERRLFEWFMVNVESPENPVHVKSPKQLSLFQGIKGFLKTKGLSIKERLSALQFCRTIISQDFNLAQDFSVQDFLLQCKQPISLIKKFWEPMALAALSTPIQQASAMVFVQTLKKIFINNNQTDFLFPKFDLSAVLPNPIIKYINQYGCSIFYNQRIQSLLIEDDQCKGVKTATREFYAEQVILATPPHVAAKLLANNISAQKIVTNLLKFYYQPITTVYLRYAKALNLNKPMIGLINATPHWIFDRSFANQPDVLSIVITGHGPHSELSHAELVKIIQQEIKIALPNLNETPLDYKVITEKRAAFSCDVGINQFRPTTTTPIANLWLAGDYTALGYPATLEGAIQSGIKAAQLILSKDAVFV